jgi:AAA domain-containing protein
MPEHRFKRLESRAIRLHRLGVDAARAVQLLDSWAAQGNMVGHEHDATWYVDYIYSNARHKDKFGAEQWTERKSFSAEDLFKHTAKPGEKLLYTYEEAQRAFEDPEMLVRNLIPNKVVTICYGDENSGKTYFTLEIATSVASGRPVLGKFEIEEGKCENAVVVIFAGENAENVPKAASAC